MALRRGRFVFGFLIVGFAVLAFLVVRLSPPRPEIQTPEQTLQPPGVPLNSHGAFLSDRDGSVDVYAVSTDGGIIRLTASPAVEEIPTLTPSGSAVLFAVRHDRYWTIERQDLLTNTVTRITTTRWRPEYMVVDPSERYVLVQETDEQTTRIILVNVTATEIQTVATAAWNPFWLTRGTGIGYHALSSETNEEAVFIRPTVQPGKLDPVVMLPSAVRIATTLPSADRAFVGVTQPSETAQYVEGVVGTETLTELGAVAEADAIERITISPDGTHLLIRRTATETTTQLLLAQSDGTEATEIAATVGESQWSTDGEAVLYEDTAAETPTLVLQDIDTVTPARRITHSWLRTSR